MSLGLIITDCVCVWQAIFFLWFALSGWLFRCLIFATWILPFAGPLLIGTLANNFIIKVHFYVVFIFDDHNPPIMAHDMHLVFLRFYGQ